VELGAARAEKAQRTEFVDFTRSINHQMHELRTAQLKLQKILILIGLEHRRRVSVRDILSYRGSDFIDACYVHLLSRAPEDAGMTYHLDLLRKGVSRTSILLEIYRAADQTGVDTRIHGIDLLLFRVRIQQRVAQLWSSMKTSLGELLPVTRHTVIATTPTAVRYLKLEELLALDHVEFLYTCYRKILGREPDPSGLASYLAQLDAGVAKSRVIGYLAYSSEAEPLNIRIRGLWWRHALAGIYSK